jgi:hypothetical protein
VARASRGANVASEFRQPLQHVALEVACRRRRVATAGPQHFDRPVVEALLDRRRNLVMASSTAPADHPG